MTRKQIHDHAVASMVDRARERHRLIENARIRADELAMLEQLHADIAAFLREVER
jgi:hypothetical protein